MSSSLHTHSHYSLLDGYALPEENLQRAEEIGLKAMAITEHGNEYSWCYYDKLHEKYPNVKLIFGVEFYECFDMTEQNKDSKYFHLIVLAKNENGRKAINQLVTDSNFHGFYYKPRIDLNALKPYANDLVVSSACLASKLAREPDYQKCVEYVREYKEIFPHFYLEMQSHSHQDQIVYNQKILQLSVDTNTPYIITTDSHAARKEDLYYQNWHVKLAHDTETAAEIYEGCYLQSDDEIHAIMDNQIGEDAVTKGLEETDRIADLIDEIHMPFQAPQLPSFPLPEGFEDNYSYLKYLIDTGWVKRGFDKLPEDEQKLRKERIDYELDIIHSMGFDGYFLIVWDFINFARENGIPIGAGRGSCAGSLVCYTITITDLDPIKYGLIFERFLNPERISMPDTDTDVGTRDEIIQYLIDKYGENRVCQIINFSFITPIVAIKDVGKVLGFNYHEMDKLSKKFVYDTIEESLWNNRDLAENPRYEELFDVASHLAGRVKTVSSHAGGVGIVDTDISDYMAMKLGTDGEHVIQVDKRIVEEIGIIKFDILGVATLNTVKEAEIDAGLTEFDVNINNPKFEMDKGSYELLRSAMTNGVFQVESAGMKDLLVRLQVSNMEELAAVLALYRPDAMDVLEEFIEYKHHPEKITYIHPDMEPILKETYGCMIYQEQLLDIVRKFGGRSYGGADLFRKAIGKKNIELVKSESKKLYYEIIENGYPEEIAKQISETLSQKGGYLFNKSHAYSYAVLCLQTAFLKKHYALCFFKALLNRNKDKAGMVNKYILDAKAFKIQVLPPNLNKSMMNFSIDDVYILFGLSAISGIGEKIAKVILEDRDKNGKFIGFENFCERINPSKSQVIQLIKAGAIPTKNKRKTLIQYLKSMYQPTTFKPVAKAPSYKQLLIKWDIDAEDYRIGDKKYDYDKDAILKAYNDKKYELYKDKEKERFQKFIAQNQKYLENEDFWEFEALQIFINDNPFDQAYKYMSKQFQDVKNGDDCTVVAVIAKVDKKKDKNKKTFAYVNLYSSFGLTEAIVWHSQLKEYEDMITKGNQIAMLCRKDSEEKVIAKKIKPYKQWLEDIKKVKGLSPKVVDSTKEYEFEIVPLYQIYYNEESLFGIYTFCTADDLPECKPYNNNDFDDLSDKKMNKCGKLVGNMQELYLGTKYKVKANMTYSKKYNEYQYKPLSIVAEVPKTFEAQKIFLKTQTNAVIADQLIAKYPNVVEDVMNGQLEMIDHSEIKGLGDKTWKKLRDKIIKNYVISDIVVMLQPYGVTLPTIERLLKSEPNPSVLKKQIEQNPYILTRVKGMGFKRVDDIALKLKPELRCSNQRLNAFIYYDLHQVGDNDGHTYVYIKNLRSNISNAASECLPIFDEWFDEESDKKLPNYLYTSGDKIGLKSYYKIEMDIYELIKDMEKYSFGNTTDYEPITDSEISQTISEVEDEEGFMFSEEQITGVNKALNCQVVFISGEAGTGKTTILKPIIKCYQKRNNSIVACALSAKAAQRIKEATGLDSRTIHRLLVAEGIDSFCYNQDNPLPADVVIMDESSMTNASLFYNFLLAIRPGTRLIFCGDYMQLPPIGFGNIFSDLLKKKGLNSVQLTKPMRQAEKSGILTDARKIRRGINPLDSPQLKIVHGELNDMFYLFRKNRESLFNMAVKQYIKSVKEEGLDNVVIISPRRSNCMNSTDELNKAVQKELFASSNKPFVEFKDRKYYLGDKVLQTSNDYERDVFNGDIGYITEIDKEKEICLVSMNANIEEKLIEYSFAQLGQLQLAYALTTHKLQGSAAQTVIGIIDNTHYKLLDNCMLYTMLTRAKKRFALLAEPEAFKRCIMTNHNKRRTWLSLKN